MLDVDLKDAPFLDGQARGVPARSFGRQAVAVVQILPRLPSLAHWALDLHWRALKWRAFAVTEASIDPHKLARWTFRVYGKSLTWRTVAVVDTFALTSLVTHDMGRGLAVAGTESFSKMLVTYPLHEAVWNKISFGLKDGRPTRTRSFVKSLSWRAFGSLDTFLVTLLYADGHSAHTAGAVACLEMFTKIPSYYLHERAWRNITTDELWERTARVWTKAAASIKRPFQKPPAVPDITDSPRKASPASRRGARGSGYRGPKR